MTGITSKNGRFTAIMPHPERTIRIMNHSWIPKTAKQEEYSPWMNTALNARQWMFDRKQRSIAI